MSLEKEGSSLKDFDGMLKMNTVSLIVFFCCFSFKTEMADKVKNRLLLRWQIK